MSKTGNYADIVIAGGKMIAERTANTTDDTIVEVVAGARAILGVLEGAAAKSLSPDECREALAELQTRLRDNDATADAEVDKRFPRGDDE